MNRSDTVKAKKEILTKGKCKIDLTDLNRNKLILLPISLPLAVLTGMFSVLIYNLTKSTLFTWLVWLVPVSFLLWYVCSFLFTRNMIQTEAFTVTQDELLYIDRVRHRSTRRYGPRYYYVEVLHFSSFGIFESPSPIYSWSETMKMGAERLIETSSSGDTFYVVTYNRGKRKPMMVYNTRLFEWKEE